MRKLFLEKITSTRLKLLREKSDLHSAIGNNKKSILEFQLTKFNSTWSIINKENPFYRYWKKKHGLPRILSSISDLKQFPILDKKIIQKNQDLIFANVVSRQIIQTGGSTGQPTSFPTSNSQKEIEYANAYFGRSQFGIKPFDKIALFWGHSHLFGSGFGGKLKQFKRKATDQIINTSRFNAYDMSNHCVLSHIDRLNALQPEVIIGYSSALMSLFQVASNCGIDLDLPKLKALITTAETL